MPIGDDIAKKYPGDKTFASHMIGIAKKLRISNLSAKMDNDDQATAWSLFEEYTGKKTKAERTHKKGQQIKFEMFMSSAAKICKVK